MPETDRGTALLHPSDLTLALALLTRLPVKIHDTARGARAAWAWPVAGAVLGGLSALSGGAALMLGLPAPVAALLALGALVMLSGGLHEDGVADTADGLWGGWTQQRRLEIMRDSRVGSYGVIALVLVLGLRGVALALIFAAGALAGAAALVIAAMVSRAAMAGVMATLPHARADGLAQAQGHPPRATVLLAMALTLAAAAGLGGASGLAAVAAAALAALGVAWVAHTRIGGQTGDILGAAQQVAEIAALLCLLP
ncbi:adenosylcobinamide-GDP ribazoletransferase [Roseovarius ramblicola]|uniref:Adenosylcobinamide-GDP ribazoletransferase n=1 Tax=Roseovarius ramblicola TaxID=2022336 RepID=A0ABV5HWT2_9RHOB